MKTSTHIDKTDWPRGEWDREPDKVQWQDAATNLVCLAVRNRHGGHWCGYVGVAEGHPLFEKRYGSIDADLLVHGGITFTDFCQEDAKEQGICHVAEPGQPERVWWIGFDCAHCDDVSPGYSRAFGGLTRMGRYRNLDYVKLQCADLAAQLVKVAAAPLDDLAGAEQSAAEMDQAGDELAMAERPDRFENL